MGIFSWLKHNKKKESRNFDDISIPIYRKETENKILETKIRPVKIPTIVDLGQKLGIILKELQEIKENMVSKDWLRSEYNDTSEITTKLDSILQNINNLNFLRQDLRGLRSSVDSVNLKKEERNIILDLLSQEGKLNYSQLKNKTGLSDPTLTKQLKELTSQGKISRERQGKSVFYSI